MLPRAAASVASSAAAVQSPKRPVATGAVPSPAVHSDMQLAELEAAFSSAATTAVGAADPVLAAALAMVRLSAEHARERATDGLSAVREEVHSLYGLLHELQESQRDMQEARLRSSSRTAFLRTLEDLIGPPPAHSWHEEWPMLRRCLTVAMDGETPTMAKIKELRAAQIQSMVEYGWSSEAIEIFVVISAASHAITQALLDGSPRFAASTHALCRQLYAKGREQQEVPQMLFCHLEGPASLTEMDGKWRRLLHPDATGFRGLTSAAVVHATDIPSNFHPEGFAIRLREGMRIFYQVEEEAPYEPIDSPVVGFESAPPDQHGAHAAVMTAQHSGTFPPNCLFRLKREVPKEEGFLHHGVRVMQQLLVVSATYLPPAREDDDCGEGAVGTKFATPTLHYATRQAYVQGLSDLLEAPVLTLEMEFDREMQWLDWQGTEYTLRDEWEYCVGAAFSRRCTPGLRDEGNEGMAPSDFCHRANEHIRERRAMGLGLQLADEFAYLTIEETIAVRLYSGPCFQPVNDFLRQIAHLTGPHRGAVARHANLTFTATVAHLCSAIRKLAAVATPEESQRLLHRGIRGELPPSFWLEDEQGHVTATDVAFMSTSRERQTPINYMGSGSNVLWELHPQLESDSGYHRGADISILSQFPHEEEVYDADSGPTDD